MIDAVIPFRSEPRHGNIELYYALRSLRRHARGLRHIYLVGDPCPWEMEGVRHIPAGDIVNRPNYSIFAKTRVACTQEEISDPFLFSNDDIYLLRDVDIAELPNYYHNTIDQHTRSINNGYLLFVNNTKKIVGNNALWFDIHVPILYRKQRYIDKLAPLDWSHHEYTIKTVYAQGLPAVAMADCKINGHRTYQQIVEATSGRMFFSTGPMGINEAMLTFLKQKFE